MSIYYYDDSLLYKFKEVFKNTVKAPTDRAFQRASQLPFNKGNVSFPLISIDRENYNIQMSNFDFGSRHRGRQSRLKSKGKKTVMQKRIPMRIDYQIDMWGKSQRAVDTLVEEVLFWITDEPNVEVIAPIVDVEQTPEDLTSDIYYLDDEFVESVDFDDTDYSFSAEFEDYIVFSYHKYLNIIIHEDKIAYRDEVPGCIGVDQDEWDDAIEYVENNMIDDLDSYEEVDWGELVDLFEGEKIPTYQHTIVIDQDLQDNSDIVSFEELGRIYRITFPFYLDHVNLVQHHEEYTVLEVPIQFKQLNS